MTTHLLGVTLAAALSAFAGRAAAAQRPTPVDVAALDTALTRLFSLAVAPGFGIVVVRDTQVVYLRSFGYADAEARRAFTPRTVFYIASITKSFTGLAAAILDEQGVFRLDAPLSRYLSGAPLKAPLDADSISIRSLLTHTHGIAGGPVELRLAFTGEYDGNDHLTGLLAHHSALPDRQFRYSNLGYNIAALAMDRATGASWKETLDRLLFTPLGMASTSAYVSRVPADRLAMPYRNGPEGYERLPYAKTDANMQSAGGLVTTLDDAARWLEAQLGEGRVDGRQILPAAAVREAHRLQAPQSRNARGVQLIGYGLGWNIGLVSRDTLYTHGGGFPGFSALVSFLPRSRIAVLAAANTSDLGPGLLELAVRSVYDILQGGAPIPADSIAALRTALERERAGMARHRAERRARPQTTPLPLAAYAGTYVSAPLGTIRLALTDAGTLEARAGAAQSAVEVYDGTKHQLRVELFGGGQVVQMEVAGDRVVGLTFRGTRYTRR